jgi:hypothetical protein
MLGFLSGIVIGAAAGPIGVGGGEFRIQVCCMPWAFFGNVDRTAFVTDVLQRSGFAHFPPGSMTCGNHT